MARKKRRVVAHGPGGTVYVEKDGLVRPVEGAEAREARDLDRADRVAEGFMETTDGRMVFVRRNGVLREVPLNRRTPAAASAFARGDCENFKAAASPGGIEAQEKEAQERLVSMQRLPIKLGSPKGTFDKLGFRFGKPIDRMLQEGWLPEGWKKIPHPGHSLYSYVVDQKGRMRWTIFFKGAFYDYEAFGYGLQRRYVVQTETDHDFKASAGEKPERGVVYDYGVPVDPKEEYHGGVRPKVLHTSHDGWIRPRDVWDQERVRRMLVLEMELWADARFPGHEDPLAYWEDRP